MDTITLKNFSQMAAAVATDGQKLPTITKGTPECSAWSAYFANHLHGSPWAFKALMRGRIDRMTVPTLRPEDFDPSYTRRDHLF